MSNKKTASILLIALSLLLVLAGCGGKSNGGAASGGGGNAGANAGGEAVKPADGEKVTIKFMHLWPQGKLRPSKINWSTKSLPNIRPTIRT